MSIDIKQGQTGKNYPELQNLRTIRQDGQLVGPAEGALAADFHIDGGEAEIVPGVIQLCFSNVQVPCHLRHKPATVGLLNEGGEFVDEPAVGQG